MHKATSLHSAKIKQMVSQYKHDMQQVEQLTAEATPYYQIAQELYTFLKTCGQLDLAPVQAFLK